MQIRTRYRLHQGLLLGFTSGSECKEFTCNAETRIQSLGQEDPPEKGKAPHSSILAWRIPWTVKSMGSQRVGHDGVTFASTVKADLEKPNDVTLDGERRSGNEVETPAATRGR